MNTNEQLHLIDLLASDKCDEALLYLEAKTAEKIEKKKAREAKANKTWWDNLSPERKAAKWKRDYERRKQKSQAAEQIIE